MKINTLNDISREEEAIATKKLEAKKKEKSSGKKIQGVETNTEAVIGWPFYNIPREKQIIKRNTKGKTQVLFLERS
jgi:hypothetical protein